MLVARGVIGLKFTARVQRGRPERRHLARAVQEAVAAADPAEAVRLLRQVWFFGDEDLRRAADELEYARSRFVTPLRRI